METLILEWLSSLLPMFVFLLIVVVLDMTGGAIQAWKKGEFKWEQLSSFVVTLVPYLWGWLTAEILVFAYQFSGLNVEGFAETVIENLNYAFYAFVVLKYVSSVVGHLASLGFQPDKLKKIGM